MFIAARKTSLSEIHTTELFHNGSPSIMLLATAA